MSATNGEWVSGYDVRKGDRFRYRVWTFTAVEDAVGEFNAYIKCAYVGTVIVPHDHQVEIIGRDEGAGATK